MTDKEKAKQIAKESQILSDFPHDYHSVEYGAMEMAEWKDQTMIEKACEWLEENIYHRVYECGDKLGFPTADFLAEFRKAMEE